MIFRKLENIVKNTLVILSAILFLWLFFSWFEIAMCKSTHRNMDRYNQYNAWAIMVRMID